MKKKDEYQKIIKNLLKKHKIKVKRWRSTCTGNADYDNREIEVPKPTSIHRFLTCLHEIGHIIEDKESYPLWKSEYIACSFEETKCQEYGFDIPLRALNRNRNYVTMNICKELGGNLNINKIDIKVLNYCNINKSKWEKKINQGYKPFVENKKGIWNEIELRWRKK